MSISDPVEKIVAEALDDAGITWRQGELDFYLPDVGVHIECKQYYTDRINEQMRRAENIILIQGRSAALAFSNMIKR